MNLLPEVPRRIILAGPTGIGKTSASLELVRQLRVSGRNASIISVDSRQCFKYLDIGTGKATPKETDDIKHYNLSILDPDQSDTAASFVKRALEWEKEIRGRNEIPVYVGGSTLHLQSLIWPLDDLPSACVYNQIKLNELESQHGQKHILSMLKKVDPDYTSRVDGYNRARIFRALDVFMQTGKPFSSYHSEQDLSSVPGDTLLVVLTADRIWHTDKINQRVDQMVTSGLVDETKYILELGYQPSIQAFQTVGYKEAIDHLNGLTSIEKMTELIKISTRQYAKRQGTWFRRWKAAHQIDVTKITAPVVASEIIRLFDSF